MKEAIVVFDQESKIGVIRWLRKEFKLSILEANDLVKNKTIDFDDYNKALEFFTYLKHQNEFARIMIDVTNTPCYLSGAFGVIIDEPKPISPIFI